MHGLLFPGVLVAVLRQLGREQRTGLLHLTRDPDPLDRDWRSASREQRALVLVKGDLACAQSNVRGEQLGPRLVRDRTITAEQLDAARFRQEANGCWLAEALLQEGVRRDDLRAGIAAQVEEIVVRALQWSRGTWRFDTQPVERVEMAGATTRQILLRALRRVREPEALRELLGHRALPLAARVTPQEVVTVGLTSLEGDLLTRADGSSSTDDVLRMAPGDRPDAERALAVLLGLGLLERAQPATVRPSGVRPSTVRGVVEADVVRTAMPAPQPAAAWGWAAPAKPGPIPAADPVPRPAADLRREHEGAIAEHQADAGSTPPAETVNSEPSSLEG